MLDAMLPYQVNYYGNPHSRTHAYGWESETAMETARKVKRPFVKIGKSLSTGISQLVIHDLLSAFIDFIDMFIKYDSLYCVLCHVCHSFYSDFERH